MQLWHSSLIISIHQLSYFLQQIISMEIKAPIGDMKFCGEVAFQKWLTTGTQGNKDSWAFHGKPKPCKPHPCNGGCKDRGNWCGVHCGDCCSPREPVFTRAWRGRVVCLQHECGDLVRIGENSPRILFRRRFREAVAPTGEQNPPDDQSAQSKGWV